ncbi:diguanylate cyclase/phosphodiesterase with PAS/PAC and GAF sensor(s) [[Leptolyngbya] sp. PCC 7376]|uniref:sensor domain-containing phosphodiesterase n=1 Tax=[Leptolyngbya] sp. PCC 7376 TaxID=111781 RepID=UPI00029F1BD5|nr:diguanylate cyclase [[Leptolyngbya] sp. PCC 7376]AFY39469.1 diguanylate cyclase/phosphodiesterase with PAS/PAC and GAF sensor(s) [[Leptolyngbya] sp. PCC 7376]
MSNSISPDTFPPQQWAFVLLLQSYCQAIAKIQAQAQEIETLEASMQQTLCKYHEAMHQYHDLREQFDHQYSQQYQQYFSLPIPCYSWQYADETLQLIDFNPAAARFSQDKLGHRTVAIGHKPEKLFSECPALHRYLSDNYQSQTSSTYHLEFRHRQLYLKVDYVYLEPDQILMFIEDESEPIITEKKLRTKARQQSTISRLGQLSLEAEQLDHKELDKLFYQSVIAVARMMELPLASLYRVKSSDTTCLLEAGYGWAEELVGIATVSRESSLSHIGHTISVQDTVVIDDLRLEKRFRAESLLNKHGVVSGVSVLVGTGENLWGVLAVYSLEIQAFSKDQINFLQAIANIIATAVHREQQTRNMNLLHHSINAIDQGVIITDPRQSKNPIIYANQGFENISGYNASEILGKNCNFLRGEQTEKASLNKLRDAVLQGKPCHVILRNYRKSGDMFWNDLQIFPVQDTDGTLTHFIGIQKDITEQRAIAEHLYESDFQFRQMFHLAPIGMAITDLEGRYITVNEAWSKTLGYEQRALQELSYLEVTYPEDISEDLHQNQALQAGQIKQFQREKRYLTKDGQVIYTIMQAVLVQTAAGEPHHVIRQMVDISDRKHMEQQLIRDALYDSLTNLPNRSLLQERLQQSIQRHQRYPNYNFAVLFLDLDHFKWVNDSLGHPVGDQLLQVFALRVQDCLRKTDTLARLGGDEFVILLDEIHQESFALQISQRIHEALQWPFKLAAQNIFVDVSIGIVQGSMNYSSPEALLRDADVAMYQAKSRGRSRSEVFDHQLQQEVLNRRHLEQDLRQAIAEQSLTMRYQPIIRLDHGECVGIAAQINWEHPRDGLIDPDYFWAIATETSLSRPLLRWGLRAACQDLQQWQQTLGRTLQLHFYISAQQLRDPQLLHLITAMPTTYGLDYQQLILEFCEYPEDVTDIEIRQHLVQLKTLGVKLFLDDLGDTNLALNSQHYQLIQGVNIKAKILKDIANEQNAESALFGALVHLAHSLDLEILVQGIQTEQQQQIARTFNCTFGQGDFFGEWQTKQQIAGLLQSLAIASST